MAIDETQRFHLKKTIKELENKLRIETIRSTTIKPKKNHFAQQAMLMGDPNNIVDSKMRYDTLAKVCKTMNQPSKTTDIRFRRKKQVHSEQ